MDTTPFDARLVEVPLDGRIFLEALRLPVLGKRARGDDVVARLWRAPAVGPHGPRVLEVVFIETVRLAEVLGRGLELGFVPRVSAVEADLDRGDRLACTPGPTGERPVVAADRSAPQMWEILVILLNDGLDPGLIVAMTGVLVAGLAAVLGIWMERDQAKPPRYAYALSALILLATVVSVMQSYLDAKAGEKMEEDMARMLLRMDTIAANSDDPALQELIGAELAAQSRSNPDVVKKLAQRVSDEGGDPTEMLGRHMDASEVESVSRKGLMKVKKPKKNVGKKKKGKKQKLTPKG